MNEYDKKREAEDLKNHVIREGLLRFTKARRYTESFSACVDACMALGIRFRIDHYPPDQFLADVGGAEAKGGTGVEAISNALVKYVDIELGNDDIRIKKELDDAEE